MSRRMSIELCVLASGSSGNCSVVRAPTGVMLIDAGLGPRLAAQRMTGTGVRVSDVAAICLTHLDRDHFSPHWLVTIVRQGIRVHCHREAAAELLELAEDVDVERLICPFGDDLFEPLPGVCVRPVPLAHDQEGSHGFLVKGFGNRLGYATDLGHVPPNLVDCFADLDLLALESNYDPDMQEQSARPIFLKRRITGGRGHLSNAQAFEAIQCILDRAQRAAARLPTHIVLLHRSRHCNCPKLVRRVFSSDPRIAPRLILSEQYARTEWLAVPGRQPLTGEQLLLAWG